MNKNKFYIAVFIASLFLFTNLQAQKISGNATSFSLSEIQAYAVKNSLEARNAELDIKIANSVKWQTTAIGLPQVSGSIEYQNFPNIPTQLMPDFISPAVVGVNEQLFGLTATEPLPEAGSFPVQFGSKHNPKWGVTVSQLLFSGEYIVGLQASKIYLELSKKSLQKKEIEIKETVTKTYYLILITEESIKVLDSIYIAIGSLLNETEKIHDVGLLEYSEVEQLRLNYKNTENSLNSFKNQKDVLFYLLKYQAGIDNNKNISLSDDISLITNDVEKENLSLNDFNINKNIDYQLMLVNEGLYELNMKREQSTYLPTLSAYYSYSKNSMSDSFDFISSDSDWYPTSVWGFNLNIPIFSSGMRKEKIKEKKLELEKVHNSKLQLEQALQLDVSQTKSDYQTALLKFKNQNETKNLAKRIYEDTLIKYKAGTESSLVLTQSQNQYFVTLSEYYLALGTLIDIQVKLKRLLNIE